MLTQRCTTARRMAVMMASEDMLVRLRAEFLEMPGMRLTSEQVQRFCGIEPRLCQLLLDQLVKTQFLCLKSRGQYARLTDADQPVPAERRQTALEQRDV